MDNNEHKQKNNKFNKKTRKNCINYKEKINNTTKKNEMKKVQVQKQKKCQTKMKRKMPEPKLPNQKYLACQAKHYPGIRICSFVQFKIYNAPKCNNIELKVNESKYRQRWVTPHFPKIKK